MVFCNSRIARRFFRSWSLSFVFSFVRCFCRSSFSSSFRSVFPSGSLRLGFRTAFDIRSNQYGVCLGTEPSSSTPFQLLVLGLDSVAFARATRNFPLPCGLQTRRTRNSRAERGRTAPAPLAPGPGRGFLLLLGLQRFSMLTGAAKMRRHTWRPWAKGVARLQSRGAHLSGGEPAAADFGSAPCVGVGRTQMRGAPVPPAPPNPDRRSLSASSSRSPSQPPSCDPPRLQGEHHIPVD